MFKKLISVFKAIWKVICWVWNLFKKKPPVRPGPTVVNVTISQNAEGKLIRIITYSDGTTKITEINNEDPTDVNGFLHDIRS